MPKLDSTIDRTYHRGWFNGVNFSLCFVLLFLALGKAGAIEDENALTERIKDCPGSPNCVSTQASDPDRWMNPPSYTKTIEEASEALKEVILTGENAELESDEGPYLHFVFISSVFKFKDDVEFFFDPTTQHIHFRSASRQGYYDFGVNARRMKRILAALEGKI